MERFFLPSSDCSLSDGVSLAEVAVAVTYNPDGTYSMEVHTHTQNTALSNTIMNVLILIHLQGSMHTSIVYSKTDRSLLRLDQ